MTLDPFKGRLRPQPISLLDLREHILYDVLVLDRFAGRCFPPVSSPIDEPIRNTIDGVFGVSDDDNVAVARRDFESAKYGRKLGALVGLAGAGKGLG